MKVRLAAQMQALAMATLNADPGRDLTSSDLLDLAKSKGYPAEDHHAISALNVLHKIGKLERFRRAYGRQKYGYCLPMSERAKVFGLRPPVAEETPPPVTDVQVSVNKTTGTLNVEYRGLRLSISITE